MNSKQAVGIGARLRELLGAFDKAIDTSRTRIVRTSKHRRQYGPRGAFGLPTGWMVLPANVRAQIKHVLTRDDSAACYPLNRWPSNSARHTFYRRRLEARKAADAS